MLKQLSGADPSGLHRLFHLYAKPKIEYFPKQFKQKFFSKILRDEEIEWYIHTKEPFDKAGAYAIQGLGTFLVKRINGSYTNVVGLPVCEVIEFLIKEGVVGLRVAPN